MTKTPFYARVAFHGVRLPGRVSKYSLWFKGDPHDALSVLIDGERIDRAGRSYPLTTAEQTAAFGSFTYRQRVEI